MNERWFLDKSCWVNGPWKSEPDQVVWLDESTSLLCVIRRNKHIGYLCGYVAVTAGHPVYEQRYDSIDVRVHGGLTFSDFFDPDEDAVLIEDLMESDLLNVVSKKLWWLGFDCGHAFDLFPHYPIGLEFSVSGKPSRYGVYRNVAYVMDECRQLAAQVSCMALEQSEPARRFRLDDE